MRTKIAPCSNCYTAEMITANGLDPKKHGAHHEVSWDLEMNPVWECRNCGHETPRRVNKPDLSKPTKSQIEQAEFINRYFRDYDEKKCEYRYFIQNENWWMGDTGTLSVSGWICIRKDRCTLADYHFHIMIGRNGGMIAYGKNSKRITGRRALWAHLER